MSIVLTEEQVRQIESFPDAIRLHENMDLLTRVDLFRQYMDLQVPQVCRSHEALRRENLDLKAQAGAVCTWSAGDRSAMATTEEEDLAYIARWQLTGRKDRP